MNISSAAILAGVAVDAWLLAFIAIRGRRPWLQATYAACTLAYLALGAGFVGINEGVLAALRNDAALGILLLSHALTAILVLGLIHGETLPRRRSVAFLLLIPIPLLAYLAPIEGWSAAAAYEGNVLGGFLVVCLGIALAETVYARYSSRLLAAHSFWLGVGVIALIVAGPVYAYELEFLGATSLAAGAGVRLRHVARGTGSTVIFSTSRLTDAERRALRDLRFTWWSLPDPAREIEAILAQSFGNGAVRLLASFGRAHGLRQEELTIDHVPALLDFLTRAVTELSGVVAGTAGHGLRAQLEAAASRLRSFAAQGAEEVARGKWPSRIASEAHPDLLVTAAEYWRGKEMDELFAAAELIVEDEK